MIILNNRYGVQEENITVYSAPIFMRGDYRKYMTIEFDMTHDINKNVDLNRLFNDYVKINHQTWRATDDNEPMPVYTDYSEYCICGDVINHKNGRFTVYMLKKTESELLRDQADELLFTMLLSDVLTK